MHAIRLRHPWQREWCDSLTSAPQQPFQPRLNSLTARVARYQRSFNRPSGLLPEQSILLVIQPADESQLLANVMPTGVEPVEIRSLTLNAHPVVLTPQNHHLQAQVKDLLQPFNCLEIVCQVASRFELPPELAELMEVRLEIS